MFSSNLGLFWIHFIKLFVWRVLLI